MCINSSFAPQSRPHSPLFHIGKYPVYAGCDLPEQGGITGHMGKWDKLPPFSSPSNPNAEGIERYGINPNKYACWFA